MTGDEHHIVDPDNEVSAIITENLKKGSDTASPLPLVKEWTNSLLKIPTTFGYAAIYEYLIKRAVTVFSCYLPISEKPLK